METKLKFDIGLEFFRCGLFSHPFLLCNFDDDAHLQNRNSQFKSINRVLLGFPVDDSYLGLFGFPLAEPLPFL